MYRLGDLFDIPTLCSWAVSKVKKAITFTIPPKVMMSDFSSAILLHDSILGDAGKPMQAALDLVLDKNLAELMKDEGFQKALEKAPQYAVRVLRSLSSRMKTSTCNSCRRWNNYYRLQSPCVCHTP